MLWYVTAPLPMATWPYMNTNSSSRRTQVLFFVFIFYTSIVVAFCSLWYITVCGMWLHGVHSNSTVFQDIILIWVSFQSSIMHPLYHQHSSRRIPPHSEKTSQSTPTFFWPHTWRMHTSIDPQNFKKIVRADLTQSRWTCPLDHLLKYVHVPSCFCRLRFSPKCDPYYSQNQSQSSKEKERKQ